jgi:hypothetical protein
LFAGFLPGHYSVGNTKFIVEQELEYVHRPDVHECIVQTLEKRSKARNEHPKAATDKMCNPLAALTAIRGLGKSTELVHFPASKEYLTYVAQGQPHPPLAPVVSVVTYGSGLDGVSNSIGLRIIYGAICAMGLAKDLDWVRFATKYQHVAISATAAVQMVREGYGGESRRVLLCVDDLYKAGPDDEAMMKELGTVLTFDGDCDIVVTSLSQKYLMQLTHRLLTFVPVLPLASTAYPLDQHVQAILQMCPLADLRTVPDKVHILRSVHILASGHPRTLAHLERILQSESTAAELADALKKPANEFTCFQFLWKLCGMLVDVPACLVVPEYAGHVRLILSTTSWYGHHDRLHSAVCKSVVQLCGPVDRDNCRPSTTLAIFLQLAVAAHNPVVPFQFPEPTQLSTTVAPAVRAFGTLLGNLKDMQAPTLPLLWVRCRMLSTVMRVLEGKSSFYEISGGAISNRVLTARFGEVKFVSDGQRAEYQCGVLAVPTPNNNTAAYDYALFGDARAGEPAVLYEHIVTGQSGEHGETYGKIVAEKLRLTLAQHLEEKTTGSDRDDGCHFCRIAFLFSRYSEEVPPRAADVLRAIAAALAEDQAPAMVQQWCRVRHYVRKVWLQNVGFLKQSDMQRCMIPATLPVADLVTDG